MSVEPHKDDPGAPEDSARPGQYGLYYHHHGPGLWGLSVDEIKVIRDCSRDAHWKWAVPGTILGGAAAYFGTIQSVWGANAAAAAPPGVRGMRGWWQFWLVTASMLLGNLSGRALYNTLGNCQDKMAALPADSTIGQTARELNKAGIRLPPYMIVAGAETGPWSYWGNMWHANQGGNCRGYGSGYRYGERSSSGLDSK
ncbi:hypothetical protein BV898_03779 [Hypsibius exemplaris]|uniref:Uncharacterized protein n=1 Tax=Hypsibius exemplaris TaxID=2072580 RepID=A0A1W0X461_HYPEX|nr:hypothetical protein BV898_03779 [Hypsibius exemplaris]